MASEPKYYLTGNLSEKQIEADVSSFLGWCTPDGMTPFRLLDINEQATGADKLYDRGVAIFIQFKKSTGLRSVRHVPSSSRKNRSPLETIREFRAEAGLQDEPSLFFQLRAKAPTAEDLQHNILLTYERPPQTRGIYVAPLILDKTAYSAALHNSIDWRFLVDPWLDTLRHDIHMPGWVSYLGTVPYLREHVSIPPHERVRDHYHYYAYSEVGTDISWHSPDVIGREPSRLSDFLVATFRHALQEVEKMASLEALAERISEASRGAGFPDATRGSDESPVEFLGRHGRWLRSAHGIRQFILFANSEKLARTD